MESTYVFKDSAEELARLINQERMLNESCGTLSGIPEKKLLRTILDLACGPGGWGLDVAFELPGTEVVGIDVNQDMVAYANARARTQQLDNVSFELMNIAQPIDFSDAYFDLVNARLLIAVLKREMWPGFFAECTRLVRPGGLLRLTEPIHFGLTNSAALNHLMELSRQALFQLGYGIAKSQQDLGILPLLMSFFNDHYQDITLITHTINYSAKALAWADMFHDIDVSMCQMKPLLTKLGFVSEETFDEFHRQVIIDMHDNSFVGISHLTTIVGKKPLQ